MPDGLDLLRKLEDTDAGEYLLSLADGEAIRVVPDAPYTSECSEHLGEIVEGACQLPCQTHSTVRRTTATKTLSELYALLC